MSLNTGFPAVSGGADQVEVRAALRATIAQDAYGNIKYGIVPTMRTLAGIITPRTDMQVNISAFDSVIDRYGPIFLSHQGVDQVKLAPAPNANSRIDVIWVKQNETETPMSDPDDEPRLGVTTGVPAANPVPPEIPDGALRLGKVMIPTSATSTSSSGIIITNDYPFTASQGGVIRFRSVTEMSTFEGIEHQKGIVINGNEAGEYEVQGGVWVSINRTVDIRPRPGWEVYQPLSARVTSGVVTLVGAVRRTSGTFTAKPWTTYDVATIDMPPVQRIDYMGACNGSGSGGSCGMRIGTDGIVNIVSGVSGGIEFAQNATWVSIAVSYPLS